MRLQRGEIESPIGRVTFVVREGALCGLGFGGLSSGLRRTLERRFGRLTFDGSSAPDAVGARLQAYFGGDLEAVDGVRVDLGGTEFQRRVWRALREVAAGETASYADLAVEIGSPGAARAVGHANARNPVALVVPCHRVLRSDGDLGGYAYGIERKRWLLEHEHVL